MSSLVLSNLLHSIQTDNYMNQDCCTCHGYCIWLRMRPFFLRLKAALVMGDYQHICCCGKICYFHKASLPLSYLKEELLHYNQRAITFQMYGDSFTKHKVDEDQYIRRDEPYRPDTFQDRLQCQSYRSNHLWKLDMGTEESVLLLGLLLLRCNFVD